MKTNAASCDTEGVSAHKCVKVTPKNKLGVGINVLSFAFTRQQLCTVQGVNRFYVTERNRTAQVSSGLGGFQGGVLSFH